MRHFAAVVIGGGAIGIAAALQLGSRGRETLLCEQFEVGNSHGSSGGPTRGFRLAYPERDYVLLARRAQESWQRLEDAAAEELLISTGGLYAGRYGDDCAKALAACGIRFEWLSQHAAEERFPSINFAGLDRIVWQEDGAVCLADRTVSALARLARATGVEVWERAEVVQLRPGDQRIVVETEREQIEASVAVVAAGPWTGRILSGVGIELSLRPSLAQVAYYHPRPNHSIETPIFVETDHARWGLASGGYWIPPVGGQTELKASDGLPGPTVDAASGPFEPDHVRASVSAAWVARRLPGIDPEPSRIETCMYTMTPDEDFVLERLGRIIVASCCSGHGFKFAPLLGEIVADLALETDPRIPQRRFRASRPALTSSGQ